MECGIQPNSRHGGDRALKGGFQPASIWCQAASDMTSEEFNAFCRALPATTYVVQWGGSHVWKVGGKVFAIASGQDDKPGFTFKVNDIAYEMLKDRPGL